MGEEIIIIPAIVIGLPWLILHYVTRWKTAATLTTDDEALLEDLYQLARRLDDRMETVERLVSADHPDFQPARIAHESEFADDEMSTLRKLRELRGRTGQ